MNILILVNIRVYAIFRRLRDWLIAEERWNVAMEISTKCGLDSAGVWSTWGLSCLRVSDYRNARTSLPSVSRSVVL